MTTQIWRFFCHKFFMGIVFFPPLPIQYNLISKFQTFTARTWVVGSGCKGYCTRYVLPLLPTSKRTYVPYISKSCCIHHNPSHSCNSNNPLPSFYVPYLKHNNTLLSMASTSTVVQAHEGTKVSTKTYCTVRYSYVDNV